MSIVRDEHADNSEHFQILTEEIVNRAARTGGTFLHTSRTNPSAVKKEEGVGADGDNSGPDLVFSRIFSEARRVLMQFETSHKKSIASVVLTGGGGVTRSLSAYAKNIFSIDVHVANPFIKTEAPAFMRPILEDIGPEFAVAVGLALRKLNEG